MDYEVKKEKGRPPKYPWEDWMDGQAHKLVHGEDFDCSPKALVVLAHREAKKAGMTARTRLAKDKKTLTIIFA